MMKFDESYIESGRRARTAFALARQASAKCAELGEALCARHSYLSASDDADRYEYSCYFVDEQELINEITELATELGDVGSVVY